MRGECLSPIISYLALGRDKYEQALERRSEYNWDYICHSNMSPFTEVR